jgi:glucose-1-phosphate thymidylyltransferase
MKGVLLHGGGGSRLRPLTHTGPKQLIPVAGKPISQYCLEDMCDAGVKEVAIVLGSVWPEKVREYYGDGSSLGMRFHYIDQGKPLGLAHAIGLAKEFVGQDKFLVYLGDNLLKGGIAKHVNSFSSEKYDAMVLLTKVSAPERFGVAKFDGSGKLEALIEKPKPPPSQFALVGVYFLTPIIFDAIDKLKPSWRGELEITDAIQTLLATGHDVQHRFVEGWWKDTGTVQDILDSNRLILDDRMQTAVYGMIKSGAMVEGRVHIGQGVTVDEGSVVRGPAYVGPHSVIGPNTYVGPYSSIGKDCRIVNSEIESSVVFDSVQILNVKRRITSSIIGAHSEVVGMNERPAGYRLIVGEQSSVKV